jgi:hypothetical protein
MKTYLPKSKVKVYELNLSDEVNFLDLFKGSMPLAEGSWVVVWKNGSSTVLNSVHPQHLHFFS